MVGSGLLGLRNLVGSLHGSLPSRRDCCQGRRPRVGSNTAFAFSEADPWCFRSGYTKERLIPAIAQFELDEAMRERIRLVILTVVDDRRRRREIRRYGQLARAVDSGDLRTELDIEPQMPSRRSVTTRTRCWRSLAKNAESPRHSRTLCEARRTAPERAICTHDSGASS